MLGATPTQALRPLHAKLYRFSETDFEGIRDLWTGNRPSDGQPLEVIDGLPETSGGMADPPESVAVSSPGLHPDELGEVMERLMKHM